MARKPKSQASPQASRPARRAATPPASPPDTTRDKIVAAFLELLAEERIERIGLSDIAAGAGVTLAELRSEFSSPLAILAAHFKAVDRALLAEDMADMAEEPERERLFDVEMRRLEIMAPHRDAVRSLMRSVRNNPPLALALNGLAVRSQQWMLAAAGIKASGPRGMLRAQGLAIMLGPVLRAWVRDDDPGLARTMAALDRALGRGQRLAGLVEDLCFIPSRLCRLRSRFRHRRDEDDRDERDDYDGDEERVTA
ncbi:MAG TPA: TetR/AcrR family transcriptional regulator [Xanthobacteraceae bacterium]|nr:TetR/AcrR family transcriptional regulator [Xanthobacteraceae bacterium]